VNNLFLSERSGERIARSLRESIDGEVTDVLQKFFLEALEALKPVRESLSGLLLHTTALVKI
jgi:hypothetical protein